MPSRIKIDLNIEENPTSRSLPCSPFRGSRWKMCHALVMVMVLSGLALAEDDGFYDLDLESLMDIQITSVSRKPQNLCDAAAAIYVIDKEDIRNSGATSIMELLRQVPGLAVAQVSANKWAITARGFNGTFANKLLVQIDGRSVYSPSFSGVHWEDQNVVLEDIERVEIIRGPGATLWGANAVNGIINIITRHASDSQGALVSVGSGNQETRLATARYGFQLSDDIYGRFHLNHHALDSYQLLSGHGDAHDESSTTTTGLRFDGEVGTHGIWTLQADAYNNKQQILIDPYWTEVPFPIVQKDEIRATGANILARWQHHYNAENSYTLQSYLDYTNSEMIAFDEKHFIFDLDFQHQFQLYPGNDIVWGVGFRRTNNHYNASYMVTFDSDKETDSLYSGFVQDTTALQKDRLWLTLGCKLEHNEFTGTEVQPSARILWKMTDSQRMWAALSRAVRTPSNYERSSHMIFNVVRSPPFPKVYVNGNSSYDSEKVLAYEVGYRYTPVDGPSIDVAIFYNKYSDLQTYKEINATTTNITNDVDADSYGLELSTRWQASAWLELQLNYTYLKINTTAHGYAPGSHSVSANVGENSSPRHQVTLLSGIDFSEQVRLNVQGRYVDKLATASPVAYYSQQEVKSYCAVDANITWQLRDNLTLQLVGKNLFDDQHLEFVSEFFVPATEIGLSYYAKLTWQY